MKLDREAFTLIELMVSITILSIMMLYLYKSYSSLNFSNEIVKKEVQSINNIQKIKKVVFFDFSLALSNTAKISNREKNEDFISLQTSNSIHKRYNPYVTYIVKKKKLYRLESLKKIEKYEIDATAEFNVDYLGELENFRVYKSSNKKKEIYLIDIDFLNMNDILLKVKVLND